jgi:hypothetical protein
MSSKSTLAELREMNVRRQREQATADLAPEPHLNTTSSAVALPTSSAGSSASILPSVLPDSSATSLHACATYRTTSQ